MTSATSHRIYRRCHDFVSLLPLWGVMEIGVECKI